MFRLLLSALLGATVAIDEVPYHSVRADEPERVVSPPLKLPKGVTPDQLADSKEAARVADLLDKQYPAPQPEAVRMLVAILRGSELDGTDGWFGPGQSRYSWAWLAERHGIDPKTGSISRKDFLGSDILFDRLDRNGDGKIAQDDLDWSDRNPYVMQASMLNRLFRRLDTSGDGKLTREELDAFFKHVANGKDSFTAEDLRRALIPRGPGGFSPGDGPTIPVLVRGLFSGEIGSMNEGPKIGEAAPDFTLKTVDGKESLTLSKLIGRKPVVLVFGNFTCGPFRGLYPDLDSIYQRYKDEATFLMVYVREAHPSDGWHMEANARVGVKVAQPTTLGERVKVCDQFCQKLKPTMPVVVDDISDPAGNAYSGMPGRFYVIDPKGKVAYKSGRGPFGFRAGEWEQALAMCLLESTPAKDPKSAPVGRAPLMSDKDVWAKLPKAEIGGGEPLPNWAKTVAVHMPRTAAAMLELDQAQRTKSPLDPALRAKMRWVIAKANRCEYGQTTALADLKRAAGDEAVKVLTGDSTQWPTADLDPLEFARLLTVAAPTITDEHFATLRKRFGDKKVAAMVLLAAYGNFQDRIILGLGIPLEADGPMPPVAVKFAAGAFQVAPILPDQKELPPLLKVGETVVPRDSEWSKLTFEDLQTRLEKQRDRTPRLSVPEWEKVKAGLPPEYASRPTRIVWSLICNGYAPELAVPWNVATRTMWAESKQDRVFEESLFWIQTRSIQCNYCMGHCEMLLEVAGLDKKAVAERTRRLAGDDWSCFPPAEQRAYAYARKLSRTPWELTSADYGTLEKDLGPEKALYTFWWLCRGLYMTRVSDGFQLPLERDNVFADYQPKK
ncbi:MAG TPA: deiodinase family protein [Gemmata sp.]|nr:deiodinase family protein [Gemmata sp.]